MPRADCATFSAPDVDTISSRRNALVDDCRALARGADGRHRRILLDGRHLIEAAHAAGVPVMTAAFAAQRLTGADPTLARLAGSLADAGTRVVSVTEPVMVALSPVRTPSGVVAIAERPSVALADALGRPPQLVIALIDIQDPGNVGAAVRTADAGGATAVVAAGSTADPFGWKALRGAMGSTFRIPVVRLDAARDLLAAAREAHLRVVATTSRGGTPLFDVDLSGPTVAFLGNEGAGLEPALARDADETVSIPMQPDVDSLNVAVSAALLVYEAYRQRRTS